MRCWRGTERRARSRLKTGPGRFAAIARRVLLLLPRAAASSNAAARMVESREREPPWTACDTVDEAVRMEEERENRRSRCRCGWRCRDAEMQAEGGRRRRKGAEGASQQGSSSQLQMEVNQWQHPTAEKPWPQAGDTVTASSPPLSPPRHPPPCWCHSAGSSSEVGRGYKYRAVLHATAILQGGLPAVVGKGDKSTAVRRCDWPHAALVPTLG